VRTYPAVPLTAEIAVVAKDLIARREVGFPDLAIEHTASTMCLSFLCTASVDVINREKLSLIFAAASTYRAVSIDDFVTIFPVASLSVIDVLRLVFLVVRLPPDSAAAIALAPSILRVSKARPSIDKREFIDRLSLATGYARLHVDQYRNLDPQLQGFAADCLSREFPAIHPVTTVRYRTASLILKLFRPQLDSKRVVEWEVGVSHDGSTKLRAALDCGFLEPLSRGSEANARMVRRHRDL